MTAAQPATTTVTKVFMFILRGFHNARVEGVDRWRAERCFDLLEGCRP
jgi:hypothetical protein